MCTDKEFINIVKNSYTYAGVCRALGLYPKGKNLNTIKQGIQELNIDTSHFSLKGLKLITRKQKLTLNEILVENSTYQSGKLGKRLIKEGIKEHKCECCNLSKWQDKLIPLELHHINGIHTDNRLENLQLLCPNCHALTDSYRGKNTHKHIMTVSKQLDSELYEPVVKKKRHIKKENKKDNKKEKRYCIVCGKELNRTQTKFCSQECSHKNQIISKPSKEELLSVLKDTQVFRQVGKIFNVTDNAVKKWCISYNIPSHSKELKEYIKSIV